MENKTRVVGIDFGLRRIGVALSDERRKVALPLATIEGGKHAVARILQIVSNYSICIIVMGLPLTLKGERGEMVKRVEKFGSDLSTALDVPIVYIDERLSSKAADASLREISLNRKERNAKIDMAAATMMLQHYLDQHADSHPIA